eukprot:762520_1
MHMVTNYRMFMSILVMATILLVSMQISLSPHCQIYAWQHVQQPIANTDDAVFPFYIFQIGFNKCATRSFTQFFRQNDIPSCHYRRQDNRTGHKLHYDMMQRYSQNTPLLVDYYHEFMFYADFQAPSEGSRVLVWQILFEQYPNSKFILNIRDVHHWLRSRFMHFDEFTCGCFLPDWERVFDETLSDVDVLNMWTQHWYTHHCGVIEWFEQHKKLHDLLIFDVENDSVNKITQFFNGTDLKLKSEYWEHAGVTLKMIKKKTSEEQQTNQTDKWNVIVDKYPILLLKDNKTEYQRIIDVCNQKTKANHLV